LNHLRYEAEKGEEYLEDFIHVNWYLSVVFEDDFNSQFIAPFNRDFRQCMRRVISVGNDRIFKRLVEGLHYSNSIQYHSIYSLKSLSIFLKKLDRETYIRVNKDNKIGTQIRELSVKERHINGFKGIRIFVDSLQEIQEAFQPYLKALDQDKLLSKIEGINKGLCFRLKLNCLIEMLFDLGAYCIFKNRFDYIYLLLTYRQPEDADANWLGRDLVPKTLESIFGFYFQQNWFHIYSPSDWDGHHGKSRYYQLYILILFLYAFSKSGNINENSCNTLASQFRLPEELDAQNLNEITNFISSKLLPSLEDLRNIQDGLQLLGLEEIDLLIREGLKPFLLKICEQISFRMEEMIRSTKISINKIDIFRANFISGYKKVISFADLFFYLGRYEEKEGLDPEGIESPLFGFSEVIDKVIFFDDWYLESDHSGEQYGQSVARSKNSALLEKIMESCQVSEETDLNKVISEFHQDPSKLIIIGINYGLYDLSDDSEKFRWKGRQGGLDIDTPGFLGTYVYEGELLDSGKFCIRWQDSKKNGHELSQSTHHVRNWLM